MSSSIGRTLISFANSFVRLRLRKKIHSTFTLKGQYGVSEEAEVVDSALWWQVIACTGTLRSICLLSEQQWMKAARNNDTWVEKLHPGKFFSALLSAVI